MCVSLPCMSSQIANDLVLFLIRDHLLTHNLHIDSHPFHDSGPFIRGMEFGVRQGMALGAYILKRNRSWRFW